MRYHELLEVYTRDNSYLRDYLKNDHGFDAHHYWWTIVQWAEDHEEAWEAFAEILGQDFDTLSKDELEEEDPDIFYRLPEHLQKEAAQWAIDYMQRNDPAEVASTEHFSLRSKRLLPRETWLLHFTDDPMAIATEGFALGTMDMTRLGLTTYTSKSAKEMGGYNFAFIADGRYAEWAASQRKYGRHAVMFQNSGVHTWHYGDEEEQVIFWGEDVKPRDIVVLMHHDDWYVESHDQRRFLAGDFEKCVAWVMANFQQYHKALTGF